MGGGTQTAASIMLVMVADTCSKERRTLAFSQLAGAVLIAEFIATPASAALIPISLWVPYLVSYGMYIIDFLFASCVPETNRHTKKPSPSQDGNKVRGKFLISTIRTELRTVQRSVTLIRENLNATLVLICFFTSSLGKQAIPLILQYGPNKFHWTIAHTSYFLSLRGAVDFVLLLVILPAKSEFLLSKRYNPALRDKRLTQVSTALHIGGAIIIFSATSSGTFVVGLIVFALGGSFHITARNLITSLVDLIFWARLTPVSRL
ncbi:adenylate cyclase [Penicillium longicatenatum]|nr:adenylate cyclase [Penicillium longicatenatum]